MATTQYIGARYVPLFADPAEWDSTKQYEPLTIVLHEGNSYTSKQYVPVGIEITNDKFWALTGNYNAQVEQYRKVVADYKNLADTTEEHLATIYPLDTTPTDDSTKGVTSDGIKKAITTAVYDETTRAKEAEHTNATAISSEKNYLSLAYYIDDFNGGNLNTALSKALKEYPNTEAIYVPSGNYVIDEPIDLRQSNISYFNADNATIKAISQMDFIIATRPYNTVVDGFIIDGNWLAKQGILLNTQATLRNCFIKNCTTDYIGGYKQGLHIYNVRVINESPAEHKGTQGIACGTDCIIQNVWVWGQRAGINCGANCIISTAYFWNYYGVEEMTGIYSKSSIHVSNIFFDCINVPLNASIIIGNNINVYVNGHDTKDNTNPYYKLTKTYTDLSQISGFNCTTADDFKLKFKEPSGASKAVNIVSSSIKTMSNYNESEFNQFNINNSNSPKNTCQALDDFDTNTWYKVAEVHHKQYYSCVIMMTDRASVGGILTITDSHITCSQSFFYSKTFDTEHVIRFNEEDGILSIYVKLIERIDVCVYGLLADVGTNGLYVLPNFEKSTLSSYNRSISQSQ